MAIPFLQQPPSWNPAARQGAAPMLGGNINFGPGRNAPGNIGGTAPIQTQGFNQGPDVGGVPVNVPVNNVPQMGGVVSRPAPIQNSGSQLPPATSGYTTPDGRTISEEQYFQEYGRYPNGIMPVGGYNPHGGMQQGNKNPQMNGGGFARPQMQQQPQQIQMPQNGGKNPQPSGSAYTQPVQPGRF